jgi:hypothetical protein
MALRGWRWFLGECLKKERRRGPHHRLASRALDLGLLGADNTTGHIQQSCGAVQNFLIRYPGHRRTIRRASPSRPFKPRGAVLQDWQRFLSGKSGTYGRTTFGYDYVTLKGYLTRKYGGRRRGGGGGDNEFEIVLRLMAEFSNAGR